MGEIHDHQGPRPANRLCTLKTGQQEYMVVRSAWQPYQIGQERTKIVINLSATIESNVEAFNNIVFKN